MTPPARSLLLTPCPILAPYRGPRGQVFVRGVAGRKGGKPQPYAKPPQ
jgi:hypothetical protein